MDHLLFTTPQCPNCPSAKTLLNAKGIEFVVVDASTPEGLDKARKYGVGSVPSLIILENEEIRDSARGLQEIESYISEL